MATCLSNVKGQLKEKRCSYKGKGKLVGEKWNMKENIPGNRDVSSLYAISPCLLCKKNLTFILGPSC